MEAGREDRRVGDVPKVETHGQTDRGFRGETRMLKKLTFVEHVLVPIERELRFDSPSERLNPVDTGCARI